jgi:hypothetical protein
MFSRSCLVVLLVLAAWAAKADAQCIPAAMAPRTETFATVKEIIGQGKSGSELYLDEKGAQVVATLRDYVGGPNPTETKLRGTLSETKSPHKSVVTCKISLSGRGQKGEIEIEGQITLVYFQGTVTRHLGRDVFSHAISLKRRLPRDDNWVGSL